MQSFGDLVGGVSRAVDRVEQEPRAECRSFKRSHCVRQHSCDYCGLVTIPSGRLGACGGDSSCKRAIHFPMERMAEDDTIRPLMIETSAANIHLLSDKTMRMVNEMVELSLPKGL